MDLLVVFIHDNYYKAKNIFTSVVVLQIIYLIFYGKSIYPCNFRTCVEMCDSALKPFSLKTHKCLLGGERACSRCICLLGRVDISWIVVMFNKYCNISEDEGYLYQIYKQPVLSKSFLLVC